MLMPSSHYVCTSASSSHYFCTHLCCVAILASGHAYNPSRYNSMLLW